MLPTRNCIVNERNIRKSPTRNCIVKEIKKITYQKLYIEWNKKRKNVAYHKLYSEWKKEKIPEIVYWMKEIKQCYLKKFIVNEKIKERMSPTRNCIVNERKERKNVTHQKL